MIVMKVLICPMCIFSNHNWLISWALVVDEDIVAVVAVGMWLPILTKYAAVNKDQSPLFQIFVLTGWHQ